VKKIFILLLLIFLVSCGESEEVPAALFEMTSSELSVYDGLSGRKAYIAVDGYIYDVTNSDAWNNGMHNSYQAGQDLSEEILLSPHGKAFLERVPKVGVLVEEPVKSMIQVIASIPGYESLVSLIYSGQVSIDFESFEEVTVFLPAIDQFLESTFEVPDGFNMNGDFSDLFSEIDVFDILRYHMVSDTLLEDALKDNVSEVQTLQGEMIQVSVLDDIVYINGVALIETDYIAENGVVHVLDGLLTPPSIDATIEVTFEGLNGDIIDTISYQFGDELIFPTPPLYGGYTFVSWDTTVIENLEDITILAVYEKVFMTMDVFESYDGLEGRDAYILVDGVIYDVTNNVWWSSVASESLQAGTDITDALRSEMMDDISNLEIVAFLSED